MIKNHLLITYNLFVTIGDAQICVNNTGNVIDFIYNTAVSIPLKIIIIVHCHLPD